MNNYILQKIIAFFSFAEEQPIFFTELSFWIFFTAVFGIFTLIYKQYTWRNLFLFLVSIFFYYKTNGIFVGLMLFTVANEYLSAKAIYKSKHKWQKKIWVIYSVVLNLGILAYFKYSYFFTNSYNKIVGTQYEVVNYLALWSNQLTGGHLSIDSIIMPIGISYFTFQILSYTIDVYKEKLKPLNNPLNLAFYATFFPQILMGPIVKARDFIPQITMPYKVSKVQFGLAIFMILNGLLKKLVFGDYMAANFIDKIFANPLLFTGLENILAIIAYSMQVYLDFSGYTDISIGIAALLGFKYKANFNSPYKAKNLGEFWKRWHISLSSWLQEYLYIPLGGNRNGTLASYLLVVILAFFMGLMLDAMNIFWIVMGVGVVLAILSIFYESVRKAVNTNINLMITMLLGGLWHNPKITFLIWGGLNGLGLVVYKFWKKISPYEKINNWLVNTWKIALTFAFISFTRIYFRADDLNIVSDIFDKISTSIEWQYFWTIVLNFKFVFLFLLLSFIIHLLPEKTKWWYKKVFIRMPVLLKLVCIIIVIFIIHNTANSEMVKFIYFQF